MEKKNKNKLMDTMTKAWIVLPIVAVVAAGAGAIYMNKDKIMSEIDSATKNLQ